MSNMTNTILIKTELTKTELTKTESTKRILNKTVPTKYNNEYYKLKMRKYYKNPTNRKRHNEKRRKGLSYLWVIELNGKKYAFERKQNIHSKIQETSKYAINIQEFIFI